MIVLGVYFIIGALISAGVGAIINAGRDESRKWKNSSIWTGAAISGAVITVLALVGAASTYSTYGY